VKLTVAIVTGRLFWLGWLAKKWVCCRLRLTSASTATSTQPIIMLFLMVLR
jgi:hypothetical protein